MGVISTGARRRLVLSAAAIIGVALIATVLILYPAVVANSIRNELRTFQPGPFPTERLREWAAKYGGSVTCDGPSCGAAVTVSNRPLNLLRLAPLTYFDAQVVTNDGKLAETSLRISNLQYGTPPTGSTTQLFVKFDGAIEQGQDGPLEHFAREPIGKAPAVSYVATSRSAPRARALAYGLNVWCLARIGSCMEAQQAPAVWALRE